MYSLHPFENSPLPFTYAFIPVLSTSPHNLSPFPSLLLTLPSHLNLSLSPLMHHSLYLFIYAPFLTYGKVSEKRDLACIIKKHNKNALRLKCYNFRRVNAIVFLYSALHTTRFLYGKIHFEILNMLHASIAMSDTPRGSNPP